MSTPEGRVKDRIKTVVAQYFPSAYRFMPMQNGMGQQGLDFYYCINGHFVAIEAKRAGKDPTALQQEIMSDIARAGGRTYAVNDEASLQHMIDDLVDLPCR